MTLTPLFLSTASHGILHAPSDTPITGIALDSRMVRPGDLFVAIPGQRVDGHAYVNQAIAAGAACLLVSQPVHPDLPHILVDDTAAALGRIAHAYRMTLSPLMVGVTGSVGKTTTKQLISAVLSTSYLTHRTEGNHNNELGLPLTLLSLTADHTAAVLEMGMSQIGEIEYLSRIARPDIGVITCIGTSHIEALGSRERIRDAKMEITLGMKPGAPLILNGDEPLLRGQDAIYVGFAPEGTRFRRIENMHSTDLGTSFDLIDENGFAIHGLTVPGAGSHLVQDAAIAATVGQLAGIEWERIREGLLSFENTGMRQRIEPFGDSTLIIDCYNAAPESMKAALNVLRDIKKDGRSIAVLGDILELGSFSQQLHASVGTYVKAVGTDLLFTFGKDSLAIANAAKEAGMPQERIQSFIDIARPEALAEALCAVIQPGDTILFKASRGIALERVITAMKAH